MGEINPRPREAPSPGQKGSGVGEGPLPPLRSNTIGQPSPPLGSLNLFNHRPLLSQVWGSAPTLTRELVCIHLCTSCVWQTGRTTYISEGMLPTDQRIGPVRRNKIVSTLEKWQLVQSFGSMARKLALTELLTPQLQVRG